MITNVHTAGLAPEKRFQLADYTARATRVGSLSAVRCALSASSTGEAVCACELESFVQTGEVDVLTMAASAEPLLTTGSGLYKLNP